MSEKDKIIVEGEYDKIEVWIDENGFVAWEYTDKSNSLDPDGTKKYHREILKQLDDIEPLSEPDSVCEDNLDCTSRTARDVGR